MRLSFLESSERPSFEMISPVLEELLPGAMRRKTASTVEAAGKYCLQAIK